MWKLRSLMRGAFDVREGEYQRTLFMGLYFFFILCASNVLKPVAWSFFLNRFEIDELPFLYLLIAVVGGALAYAYTKVAVRTSLRAAVTGATAATVISLVVFWRLIDSGSTPVLYTFNVWVNLFGIVFVSQGWLIAANIFDSREAKRLYALLGLGAILGAASGGSLTAVLAGRLGSKNLLPAGILLVMMAFAALYAAGVTARRQAPGRERLERGAASSEDDEQTKDFTLGDVIRAVVRYRHLLVIVAIISITFLVEVLVEFQFNAQARAAYLNDRDGLTAFLGRFSGIYLSAVTFVLQFFFTTLLVRRLGVGRTLLISPVSVGVAATGLLVAPGLLTAALTRLLEASTRYSVTRTAIELLYLPLPAELKSRTKAFVDVFVDRLGRGVAALLLLALTAAGLTSPRQFSVLLLGFAGAWVLLAVWASREYLATVRQRVESRRLDLESARVTVQDTETVRVLEHAARAANPRQVTYALSLLAEAPGYNLAPLLEELGGSPSELVREKVYELARRTAHDGLADRALAEIERNAAQSDDLIGQAVAYVLEVAPNPLHQAARFMDHARPRVPQATLEALSGQPEQIHALAPRDWVLRAAGSPKPERRALAAFALGVRGDKGFDALHRLLRDGDPRVVRAACLAAGRLANPDYLDAVTGHLGNPNLRAVAIEALAQFGPRVIPHLGRLLEDEATPETVRRQIPRVLAGLPVQQSADALRRCIGLGELAIRSTVLRALNRLRLDAPGLDFGEREIEDQIRQEAVAYYRFYAALACFREKRGAGDAVRLLTRTVEERLRQTVERLFQLLGLRYPPQQIRAAYLAVSHRRAGEFAAALEFLDNLLENDLRDFLIPMIDGSPHLLDIGQERFGVEAPDIEAAVRQLIRSGDTWLASVAIAASAELGLRSVRDEIAAARKMGPGPVAQVADGALAALG